MSDNRNKFEKIRVQASEVNYELHTLGWKGFQNLCTTILGEIWGQAIQGFFDSHDGGRDGAFFGNWSDPTGNSFEGAFTVQCKFTAKADKQLSLAVLDDELEKATRLGAKGLATNYFLLTNARLTGLTEEKIKKAFERIPGIERFIAYGADRISQIIRESSRLRMLVPRIYGLGDLSQILDERAHVQAKEILSSLGEDLAKFVITDAYRRSAKALVDHGFVLLLGEPACGKSTIAAALALGALDEWGCGTFKIRSANDFVEHSNPHEPKQFFWVDDAFGATQLDLSSVSDWNQVFAHMNAAIRRGARVLFTSRDYIYQGARSYLKESALPVFRESQVVIHVEKLTESEREQILYNHIRLGQQSVNFKKRIKPFLSSTAAHRRFSPEIARRLGEPLFTAKISISREGIDDFVENPVELLCEIIRTIDHGSRSALALVFMRGGSLPSPVSMTDTEERAIVLMGGNMGDARNALNALNGSLLLHSVTEGAYTWRFKHPTVRDAFAEVVAEDRELMDIYLSGAPMERLFDEVTCGNVGLKGAKVIIPPDRYGIILARLKNFDSVTWEGESRLHRFLTYRCDRDFLEQYIQEHNKFLDGLRIGSYLTVVSSVRLLGKLNEFGLLPEAKRLSAVKAIGQLAISIPDAGFLSKGVREILRKEEVDQILEDIRLNLVPNLDSTLDDWRINYDENDDPEDHFYELTNALETYQEALCDDLDSWEIIETGLSNIKEQIETLKQDLQSDSDSEDFKGSSNDIDIRKIERSIFDDVDE